jgi:hypothetical protein
MKTKIAGIGVAVGIFCVAYYFALGPLKLRGDAVSSVGPLLGMLLAVSLILERSTEVILSAFRGGSADLQDLEISELTEKIKNTEAAGRPVTDLR